MSKPFEVRLLTAKDDTSHFRSDEEKLDKYLHKYALSMHNGGGPRTYLAVAEDGEIIGYYSLINNSIKREIAPEKLSAGMGSYPIATTLIARFVIAEQYQGQGIGGDLLLHALMTAVSAAEKVGSRAIEVDALNEDVVGFYKRYLFKVLDEENYPFRMYELMKIARQTLRENGLL